MTLQARSPWSRVLPKVWGWQRRGCSPRAAPPSCWPTSTAISPRRRQSGSSARVVPRSASPVTWPTRQVVAMVDGAVAKYGKLDMAFNNAGIQVPPSDAADESIENFERVTAVNQRGVWACMKHELRVMREQGSGAIV